MTLKEAAQEALEALEWYVKNDDTMETEFNKPWLDGKERAEKAIKMLKLAIKEAKKNGQT